MYAEMLVTDLWVILC